MIKTTLSCLLIVLVHLFVPADVMANEFRITDLKVDRNRVAVGEIVRLDASLSVSPENPDDPSQVMVWAVCKSSAGVSFTQPGFFYRDYRIDPKKGIVPTGVTSWQVRFSPMEAGAWRLLLKARQGGKIITSAPIKIEADTPASDWRGYVRIDPNRPRYLRYGATDTPFFGIGANIFTPMLVLGSPPSPGQFIDRDLNPLFLAKCLKNMESQIEDLAESGGNLVRLRLDSWWTALESPDLPLPGLPNGALGFTIGRYHAPNAWIIDRLMDCCRKHGIVVQLCTWNPNTYLFWGKGEFDKRGHQANDYHCYAAKTENEMLVKRRLWYQVARWGSDPTLGLWEFFNEIGNNWNDTATFDINSNYWCMITEWLRNLDPYGHPITNSKDGIDTHDLHAYLEGDSFFTWTRKGEISQLFTTFYMDPKRPFILGEYGANNNKNPAVEISHIREGLWAAVCSGKAGAMNWRLSLLQKHNHVEPIFAPVVQFLAGEKLDADWRGINLRIPDGLYATGMCNASGRSFIYIVRTPCNLVKDRKALQGVALEINGLPDGTYEAHWHSTHKTGALQKTTVLSSDGILNISLPSGVQRDIALKLLPKP